MTTASTTPPPATAETIPLLRDGDRMTRAEFERRYDVMPEVMHWPTGQPHTLRSVTTTGPNAAGKIPITRSPAATSDTSGPTSSTMPAPSLPKGPASAPITVFAFPRLPSCI